MVFIIRNFVSDGELDTKTLFVLIHTPNLMLVVKFGDRINSSLVSIGGSR